MPSFAISRPGAAVIGVGLLALAAGAALVGSGGGQASAAGKNSAVAAYLSGRVAQGAGDWSRAAELISEALKADPKNPELLRRAFLLHLGEGDGHAAADLARRLAEQDQPSFIAATLLVADDLVSGRTKEAQARAAKMPEEGLGRYAGPLVGAWADVAAGDSDKALMRIQPVGQVAGFAPLLQLESALIEDLRNKPEAARVWYDKLIESGAPLRVVQLVGNFYERTGHLEEAKSLYERYRAASGDNPATEAALARVAKGEVPKRLVPGAKEGMAEVVFGLAAALNQENSADLALLYARISLMLAPEQPLAQLLVGDVLAARDRHEDALRIFSAIKADSGMTWTARMRQAETLRQLGRTEPAAKLLESMAAERSQRTDALVRLGDLYRSANQNDKALSAYDRAVQRVKDPKQNDWLLFYARGIALDAVKRWPDAEKDLKRALELNPQQPHVLNYLGYSWLEHGGDLNEARALIEKAVKISPNDGYFLDSLGWAKFRAGDNEGALKDLERAVQLKPMDPAINDHLGDVYWALGQHILARFQWSRAAQEAEEADLKKSVEEKLKREIPVRRTAERLPEAPSTPQ